MGQSGLKPYTSCYSIYPEYGWNVDDMKWNPSFSRLKHFKTKNRDCRHFDEKIKNHNFKAIWWNLSKFRLHFRNQNKKLPYTEIFEKFFTSFSWKNLGLWDANLPIFPTSNTILIMLNWSVSLKLINLSCVCFWAMQYKSHTVIFMTVGL